MGCASLPAEQDPPVDVHALLVITLADLQVAVAIAIDEQGRSLASSANRCVWTGVQAGGAPALVLPLVVMFLVVRLFNPHMAVVAVLAAHSVPPTQVT